MLEKLKSLLLKNNLRKNILLVSGGTLIAQVISGLLSPIITRLYSPESFGILSLYTAIISVFRLSSTLKYELSIPIVEKDEDSINIVALCLIILVIFSFIFFLIVFFWGHEFLKLFNAIKFTDYKYLIPIGIFFTGLYNIFIQVNFRIKDYKSISKTKIYQSVFQNLFKIIFGILSFGPVGLVVSSIIGESSGNTILIKSMFRKYSKKSFKFSIKKILFFLKRYKRFPIYATPSQIIGAFSSQMPVFFLSVIYGSQVTGYYGLAFSIINLPMMLIGESFGNVFYSEAASLKNVNVEKIKDLSQKFLKKLFIFGLIPFVILLLFGPFLFSFVFGDQWYEAGQISRVLSFLMFFRLVFTPISRIYSIFERQKEAFIIDIVRTLILALFFILTLILKFDYIFTLLIYSFISSFFSFIVFVVAQKIINNEIKNNN